MAFQLTWLATVLSNAGLKVSEVPGWMNRGRGPMASTVEGVVCHHTVGPRRGNMPSLNVLVNGRRDLAGPLAQLGLGRDGTYFIIAAGRANHAGSGSWQGKSGNSRFIGIEAENTGHPTGPKAEPWPAVQLDAYKRGVAAILLKINRSSDMVCGHKEWRSSKPDPHTINMDVFRSEVAAIMAGTVPPLPPIPPNDPSGRPTMRRGRSSNPKFLVKEVQKKVGFSGEQVDGIFGPLTEAAVRRFQDDNGLVPDGIVGPKTWAALENA
jgi:hypothetical protein